MTKAPVAKEAPATNVAVIDPDLEALLKAQTEGADADSFAIPFVKMLQSNSPQCTPGHGAFIEDARPGMIFNTVNKTFSKEISVVPVFFKREFLEWKPERKGLAGRHGPASDVVLNCTGKSAKGQPMLENGNLLIDTRQHYVLVTDKSGNLSPALLPLASTQLKKSRNLMTLIAENQKHGRICSYKLHGIPESNDQGNWQGWAITQDQDVTSNDDVKEAMLDFLKAIKSGRVEIDETQFGEDSTPGSATSGDAPPF